MTGPKTTPASAEPRADGPAEAAGSRPSWAERATDRSPAVQRSRARSAQQLEAITRAARRLIQEKGTAFTTAELTKESGVALQTIYRHFAGKDQILLAVVEEVIAEQAVRVQAEAQLLSDPVERLRLYITGTLNSLRTGRDMTGPQFITAEHWRLHQLFPDDMARATQPFGDLIEQELRAAAAAGLLKPRDPRHDAWFTMKLVTATYHHYAFATAHESVESIAEHLWAFCLTAFGGDPAKHPSGPGTSGASGSASPGASDAASEESRTAPASSGSSGTKEVEQP